MDLYASLSFEGMRNFGDQESVTMIGPSKLKDYICRPPEELCDLQNDPSEVCNLAGNPRHSQTLQSMRHQALEKWQKETGDLWLWRDGAPVIRYLASDYAREGLQIPNRFDFDAEKPRTDVIPSVKLI
ncbi:Fc.00g034450.m01.CDS01 [Cosmosporella sp. VM-42]